MINFYALYNKDILENTDIYRKPIENTINRVRDVDGINTIRHILLTCPHIIYWLGLMTYRDHLDVLTPIFLDAVKDKSPGWLLSYARDVLRGRWFEVEHLILKSPAISYEYAEGVVHGRWLEAENTIKTDPEHCFYYSVGVLKAPWPEAEHVIKDSIWWDVYINYHKMKS